MNKSYRLSFWFSPLGYRAIGRMWSGLESDDDDNGRVTMPSLRLLGQSLTIISNLIRNCVQTQFIQCNGDIIQTTPQ